MGTIILFNMFASDDQEWEIMESVAPVMVTDHPQIHEWEIIEEIPEIPELGEWEIIEKIEENPEKPPVPFLKKHFFSSRHVWIAGWGATSLKILPVLKFLGKIDKNKCEKLEWVKTGLEFYCAPNLSFVLHFMFDSPITESVCKVSRWGARYVLDNHIAGECVYYGMFGLSKLLHLTSFLENNVFSLLFYLIK
jgi:hypothetical protein